MSSLSRSTPRKRVPYLLLTGIIIPLICLVPFSTGVYAEETGLPIASTTYAESGPASERPAIPGEDEEENGEFRDNTQASEDDGVSPAFIATLALWARRTRCPPVYHAAAISVKTPPVGESSGLY